MSLQWLSFSAVFLALRHEMSKDHEWESQVIQIRNAKRFRTKCEELIKIIYRGVSVGHKDTR